MEAIDTRIFDLPVLAHEADIQLQSPDLDRFWQWYLGHATSKPKTKIEYCRRFVSSCEAKLERVKEVHRRRQIIVGIAAARSRLGTELSSLGDPEAGPVLNQSVVEACSIGHPETAYYALHALALHYRARKHFEISELLFMRSIAYAGHLGPNMVGLVFNRVGHVLQMRSAHDKAAWLEEWQSTYDSMPLGLLLKRAKRLFDSGFNAVLETECEVGDVRSCWHIGRAVAASRVLGRNSRLIELCEEGLLLANSQENAIWIRAFNEFSTANW